MKKVTLSFVAPFDSNLDSENKFLTVESFFNEFYLKSLSMNIEERLKIDAHLSGKEEAIKYGVDTLLSFVRKISEETIASVKYSKTENNNEYYISFSFNFDDSFSSSALNPPSIEKFIDFRMITLIKNANKMMADSLKEVMPRNYALINHLVIMLEALENTRNIDITIVNKNNIK